ESLSSEEDTTLPTTSTETQSVTSETTRDDSYEYYRKKRVKYSRTVKQKDFENWPWLRHNKQIGILFCANSDCTMYDHYNCFLLKYSTWPAELCEHRLFKAHHKADIHKKKCGSIK